MKKTLLTLATIITTTAAATSIYMSTLPTPTDTQRELSNTANTITIAGATTIFGLLNDNEDDQDS
jgi:ABC-type phosphate transport system substrate-binding protein